MTRRVGMPRNAAFEVRRQDVKHFERGRLAQLGERLPYKQEVAGSRPAPPIIQARFLSGIAVPLVASTENASAPSAEFVPICAQSAPLRRASMRAPVSR
jgi:hypothetical protein